MTVDIERLTSAWLRTRLAVTDITDRIYTEIPKSPTFPLVRLTLIDERQIFAPRYLTSSLLQIDVYGGPKVLARQIADEVCDELTASFPGQHTAGVVTFVDCSMRYLPDDSYDPPKPRYVVEAVIFSHP